MTTPNKHYVTKALELLELASQGETDVNANTIAEAQVYATLNMGEQLHRIAEHLKTVTFHMGEQ